MTDNETPVLAWHFVGYTLRDGRPVLADGENVLRAFARWCALQVAHLWDMPDVVRQYLETGGELLRDAARAAAWAAAWDAASSASRAAASAAAWAAAWDAASAAAEAAAWAAADATVWNAARDEQNEQLERMVEEARQGRIEWVWQAAQEPRQ